MSEKMLLVGKICGVFGVKGWIKIFSYTERRENICTYLPLFIHSENQTPSPLQIEAIKAHNTTIIAKIKAIETKEQANELLGRALYIYKKQLPNLKTDEYYWSDLIGLDVINISGELCGVIKRLFNAGANDIMVINDSKNNEHLVPYVPHYVLKINLAQRQIVLSWLFD